MRLLAFIVFTLAASVSALANGTPCGVPPQLENAEAQQTITTTVREDLGAAPVEAPFLDRARRSIDELADTFDLPRADVVDLYLFHICEALYTRGTGPDRLGQVMSRVKQALERPPEAGDEKEAAAGTEEKSASPGVMGGGAPVTDDAPDAPTTQALGTAEVENGRAPTSQEQAAEKDRAASREGAETDSAASREGAETDSAASREGAALGPDDGSASSDASSEDNGVPGTKPSKTAQSAEAEPSGDAATDQKAAAKPRDREDSATPDMSADTATGETAAPKPQNRQGSAKKRATRRPEPRTRSFSYAPPQGSGNGPNFNQFSAPRTNRMAETPDNGNTGQRGSADTGARGDNRVVTRAPAAARPQAPSHEAPTATQPPRALAERARPTPPSTASEQAPVTEPMTAARPQAEAARSAAPDETAGESAAPEAAPPEAEEAAEPDAETEEAAEGEAETAGDGDNPAAAARSATPQAAPEAARGPCPERGVLGPECFDVDEALERLSDRPVEYNHPPEMIRGQATEISLVLRTDFTGEGVPEEVSEAFETLQGEVQQQRAKIANVMSARLRGRDFEIDPAGMQERSVTWRRPVEWSWYVTPKSGGEDKRLELELYAHIVNPQGERQPPVLIKTLDATIDVDVHTLDWLIEQASALEPVYKIAAGAVGLFTALLAMWLRRRSALRHSDGGGPSSSITATQTPIDRRVADMSAGEAAAAAARKGQDEDGGPPGNGRA